jgi:hypothetical protein
MQYSLKDNATGGVDLVRSDPKIVGTFHDREVALQVLNLLLFPAKFVDVPKASLGDLPSAETTEPAPPERLPVSAAKEVVPAQIHYDLDSAFKRIRNGEKIADVAADVGTTMGSLRAKWANNQRYINATVNAANRSNCVLCEKEFTPSAISPDKCARCARD